MEHVLAAARAAQLTLLNLCVWDKGSGGMGSFYRSQHELIFVLKKGRPASINTIKLGKNGRNPPQRLGLRGRHRLQRRQGPRRRGDAPDRPAGGPGQGRGTASTPAKKGDLVLDGLRRRRLDP